VSRADRVSVRLAEHGLDALLVTDPFNLRYVTGFTGSSGLAVVGSDVRRFVTDFRYVEQARHEVQGFDRERAAVQLLDTLADGWPERSVRLGFDDATVAVRTHALLVAKLPGNVELVPAAGVVEAERAIKEPGEIETLRAAAAIVDEIYAWILERGLVGRTERDVAVALEHEMRLRGASGPSFPSIVASGEHGALPHAQPRDVPIARDTLVTIDIGARVDGYCSDCTRTYATGEGVSQQAREVYALVLAAQEAGLQAVQAGPTGREVDAIARAVIDGAGQGENFGHGLGHGVGMEIHEAPRLSRTEGERHLQAGNVVTVEPGVYLPGLLGVRIEDLVVVREGGREVLNGLDKALTVIV
jgi:Xaa-Pro aminopeptidase